MDYSDHCLAARQAGLRVTIRNASVSYHGQAPRQSDVPTSRESTCVSSANKRRVAYRMPFFPPYISFLPVKRGLQKDPRRRVIHRLSQSNNGITPTPPADRPAMLYTALLSPMSHSFFTSGRKPAQRSELPTFRVFFFHLLVSKLPVYQDYLSY
jgi:hypothetical protein